MDEEDEFADLLTDDDIDDFPSSVSGAHVVIAPPPTRDDMTRLDLTNTQDSSVNFEVRDDEQAQPRPTADNTMEQMALNPDDFAGIDLDKAALDAMDQLNADDDFGGLLVTDPDDEPAGVPDEDDPEKKVD